MPPKLPKYLFDIQQACESVTQFVSGKSFAQYIMDPMLKAAVERKFEIIGEAVGQIAKLDPTIARRITAAKRIVAFRNLLIHNYWDVADDLVWGIVDKHLPVLQREVNQLLREFGGPPETP